MSQMKVLLSINGKVLGSIIDLRQSSECLHQGVKHKTSQASDRERVSHDLSDYIQHSCAWVVVDALLASCSV